MPVDIMGLFEFAAPPFTGSRWLLNEIADRKLPLAHDDQCLLADAEKPWKRSGSNVRLTFVCNPILWLQRCHKASNHSGLPDEFQGLAHTRSFGQFAHQYMTVCPGAITRLFERYEAGVVQRLEDQPWAFTEFLESLGVPDVFVRKIQGKSCEPLFCGGWLRTELRRADEKLFGAYDYW